MSNDKVHIDVIGVRATVRALKAFAPDVSRRLVKEIRQSLNIIKARAQGKYPLGMWNVRVNNKNMLGTVVAASGGGAPAGRWSDASPGVRAAVFEFAGSTTNGASPQAQGMIEALTRRYGTPGRFLWAAWDEAGKQVLAEIEASVKAAERDLQASLDSAGESF